MQRSWLADCCGRKHLSGPPHQRTRPETANACSSFRSSVTDLANIPGGPEFLSWARRPTRARTGESQELCHEEHREIRGRSVEGGIQSCSQLFAVRERRWADRAFTLHSKLSEHASGQGDARPPEFWLRSERNVATAELILAKRRIAGRALPFESPPRVPQNGWAPLGVNRGSAAVPVLSPMLQVRPVHGHLCPVRVRSSGGCAQWVRPAAHRSPVRVAGAVQL
jgi:hypothetical protein